MHSCLTVRGAPGNGFMRASLCFQLNIKIEDSLMRLAFVGQRFVPFKKEKKSLKCLNLQTLEHSL